MAKKPKKTDAQKWIDKIGRASKVREEWYNKFRVALQYQYWEGAQIPQGIPASEWITINKIYSTLMAELPVLYNTDPYFNVRLKKSYAINPMDIALWEGRAKVRQAMLNYLKSELDLKNKARLSIFDAHFQYGVCKVYYQADMVENPDKDKAIMGDGGQAMFNELGEYLMEPETIPANEAYIIERIHPDDYLVDEDAGPLKDTVSWVAQRIKRPVEDVKKDKRYRESVRIRVQATESREGPQKERDYRQKGGLASEGRSETTPDIAVLWEIYDLKTDEWMVISEGADNFLLGPEPVPIGIDGDPFVDLRFVKRDASWYPLPPVSQLIDSQREYCEARSKFMVHRKRFNRKYELYGPGYDDPELAATKLEGGEDGTVIIKNQPTETVSPIRDAPLDQNHVLELQMLNQDFQELAIGANQRGMTQGVESATEAGIIEKRTMLREGDKVGMVMDFIVGIGRKLDQLVQAHLSQDVAVKVSGGPQGEYWEAVKTRDYDEIKGEYEYSINVGATTPQIPEIERAQWMAFLGLIAQAPHLALSKLLLKRTAEMHHIYDDAMLEEISKIAQAVIAGQGAPKGVGSQPNLMEQNPAAMGPGAAMGMANIRGGMQ